ncbi:MAG: DUF4258 domain-containing protein [Patescibacteria group bacterium]
MLDMKFVAWDQDKNERLKDERGISFEEVMDAIVDGKIIVILRNKNQDRYPNQRVFIVDIDDYIYLIPFVEGEDKLFLKTIYPSRKHTKQYIEKGAL